MLFMYLHIYSPSLGERLAKGKDILELLSWLQMRMIIIIGVENKGFVFRKVGGRVCKKEARKGLRTRKKKSVPSL